MAAAQRARLEARIDWRDIAARAGPRPLPAKSRVPTWTQLAADFSVAAKQVARSGRFWNQDRPTFFSECAPLPFEDLLAPVVLCARRRLRQMLPAGLHPLLTVSAWAQWERWLLERLLAVGGEALWMDWNRFNRAAVRGRISRNSVALYREFIQTPWSGGFFQIYTRYPVLARLWAVLVQQWIRFAGDVLRHLQRDWIPLRAELLPQLPPRPRAGVVTGIVTGLSDPHHGGKTVLVLKFQSGGRVVYKPRRLAPDRVYFRLLDRLNHLAPAEAPRFRVAKFCGRTQAQHGWMEWIAPAACRRPDGPRRFYWQMGALTALHFLLRAVDGHDGNWIAAGEQPVCTDLETLWHPTFAGGRGVGDTVLRTGMLPVRGYTCPAIGSKMVQRTLFARRCWRRVNTDQMFSVRQRILVRQDAHVPRMGRRNFVPLTPAMRRAVLTGFSALTDQLLSDASSRTALRTCIIALRRPRLAKQRRWLVRTTVTYEALLQRARRPEFLRDGHRRHQLLTSLRDDPRAVHPRSLWQDEISALGALDIPRVSASACRSCSPHAACITLAATDAAMRGALQKTLRRQLRVLTALLAQRS